MELRMLLAHTCKKDKNKNNLMKIRESWTGERLIWWASPFGLVTYADEMTV